MKQCIVIPFGNFTAFEIQNMIIAAQRDALECALNGHYTTRHGDKYISEAYILNLLPKDK